MLRSCLVLAVAYGGLFGLYQAWLGRSFDPPIHWIGGAVAALLVGGSLGALYNAFVAYREWSLLAAARHDLPWSDGRWIAVAGPIQPVETPVAAPFSGRECVLCEYDVADRQRVERADSKNASPPGTDFTGFLMNPCVIRTNLGDIRLLGFPNLAEFDERTCSGPEVLRSAYDFLTQTQFEDRTGWQMVKLFRAIQDAWTDDDGKVEIHLRLTKRAPEELFEKGERGRSWELEEDEDDQEQEQEQEQEWEQEPEQEREWQGKIEQVPGERLSRGERLVAGPVLKEKRVPVGEEVCAIGVFDSARRGLRPGGLGADRFIRLVRGGLNAVADKTQRSVRNNLLGGMAGLLVVHAAVWGIPWVARNNPQEVARRPAQAAQAVADGDLRKLERLMRWGVGVNDPNEDGETLLFFATDAATARWLLARGAKVDAASQEGVTPLMEAARQGRTDVVQELLRAGTDVHARSAHYSATALDFAAGNGRSDVVEVLLKAGARTGAAAP